MIERKAFFISGSRLTGIAREKETLVIFDLNNNTVTGVETIHIKNKYDATEELLLFLQRKYVRLVYVSEMDDKTKDLFLNYGIKVNTLHEKECDWLCDTLYWSPPSF